MTNIIQIMELILRHFSNTFIILLELMGGIILIFGCLNIFYLFFFPAKKDFSTKLRIKLGRYTSLALEFFLAAEILKTVKIRDLTELYVIAAIIILRILMMFVVHWEMRFDFKELKDSVKKRHSEKRNQ